MKSQKIIDHIVNWMKTYLDNSPLTGFCIGVSGGIDSAVTATLCARTSKPVLALNMPIYQAPDQVDRSKNHIAWLKKKYGNVNGIDTDLTPVFSSIQHCFPNDIQDDMTMANTRSRLRMLCLYAFASSHKLLVAGTGNKVEDFGVGFFTKYGDGGVDISPIADLGKTQVYELGKALGIHQDIITAAPTDGLWDDGRSDEDQIGATYKELEWAMQHLDAPDDLQLTRRQQQVLKIYNQFHSANQHKMIPIPVCKIPANLL